MHCVKMKIKVGFGILRQRIAEEKMSNGVSRAITVSIKLSGDGKNSVVGKVALKFYRRGNSFSPVSRVIWIISMQ